MTENVAPGGQAGPRRAHGPDARALLDLPAPAVRDLGPLRYATTAVGGDVGDHHRPGEDPAPAWVVELFTDPGWYAVQQSTDPLPAPAPPAVIPLRGATSLVGRPSRSRDIVPDVDCDPDTGTSRRQALLHREGERWFVEDLGSANGTYLGRGPGPLPLTPLPPGRHELQPGDRIYVGAWTRLQLRPATPDDGYATP